MILKVDALFPTGQKVELPYLWPRGTLHMQLGATVNFVPVTYLKSQEKCLIPKVEPVCAISSGVQDIGYNVASYVNYRNRVGTC